MPILRLDQSTAEMAFTTSCWRHRLEHTAAATVCITTCQLTVQSSQSAVRDTTYETISIAAWPESKEILYFVKLNTPLLSASQRCLAVWLSTWTSCAGLTLNFDKGRLQSSKRILAHCSSMRCLVQPRCTGFHVTGPMTPSPRSAFHCVNKNGLCLKAVLNAKLY